MEWGEVGKINFVLPQFSEFSTSHPCWKDWCEKRRSFQCGCPDCLASAGLTVVYHSEDWNAEGTLREHWRKLIVSQRVGNLVREMIVQGYPGGLSR